jgi:hypothetical protein
MFTSGAEIIAGDETGAQSSFADVSPPQLRTSIRMLTDRRRPLAPHNRNRWMPFDRLEG